jgi:hypothetical protein
MAKESVTRYVSLPRWMLTSSTSFQKRHLYKLRI